LILQLKETYYWDRNTISSSQL